VKRGSFLFTEIRRGTPMTRSYHRPVSMHHARAKHIVVADFSTGISSGFDLICRQMPWDPPRGFSFAKEPVAFCSDNKRTPSPYCSDPQGAGRWTCRSGTLTLAPRSRGRQNRAMLDCAISLEAFVNDATELGRGAICPMKVEK